MRKKDKIFIAGHRGLAGSAIMRALTNRGYHNLVVRSHSDLDLENQAVVERFFAVEKPSYAILAAAKVGGIKYNMAYPADFIRSNLYITMNILEAARRHGIQRLIFFGSSCMYPRVCAQPMKESMLNTGEQEPTSLPYSTAKLAGTIMCGACNRQYGTQFLPVIPATLYGPGDSFDPDHSHVLPALLRRIHEARLAGSPSVTIWGSGSPRREFLYIEDLAKAVIFLLEKDGYTEVTNIGAGSDISISELAKIICGITGYKGKLKFDSSKPDGAHQKLLNTSKMDSLGWKAATSLKQGIELTYKWFLEEQKGI